MSLTILGLATVQPAVSIDQHASATLAAAMTCATEQQRRVLPTLYRRSGVNRRGSVLLEESNGATGPSHSFYPIAPAGEHAGPTTAERMRRYEAEALPLAQRAAQAALDDARFDPRRIDHLVTVSCTGFAAPGFDVQLIKTLGLLPTTSRTHIGFMGCHGAFNGLRVARGLVRDARESVLLCATELCSLHFVYGWKPQQIVANALFADGSAAVVAVGGDDESSAAPDAQPQPWRLIASGSTLIPDSEDAMTWHIGDHGFEMTLSPRVPDLIRAHLRPWLEAWLQQHGLTIDAVRSWAVHPGGPRVLAAAAEAIGIAHDDLADSHQVLASCGNMSSPTVLFILDRLRRRNAPRPCVALGFGPGLTTEAMLFD